MDTGIGKQKEEKEKKFIADVALIFDINVYENPLKLQQSEMDMICLRTSNKIQG